MLVFSERRRIAAKRKKIPLKRKKIPPKRKLSHLSSRKKGITYENCERNMIMKNV